MLKITNIYMYTVYEQCGGKCITNELIRVLWLLCCPISLKNCYFFILAICNCCTIFPMFLLFLPPNSMHRCICTSVQYSVLTCDIVPLRHKCKRNEDVSLPDNECLSAAALHQICRSTPASQAQLKKTGGGAHWGGGVLHQRLVSSAKFS